MKLVRSIFIMSAILCGSVSSQPQEKTQGGAQLKERMMTMKKVRLLEMLELKGEAADKFLVRYNAEQQKIDELKKVLDNAVQNLQNAVQSKQPDSELSAKADETTKAYDAWLSGVQSRLSTLRSILSATQYAKLVMFEIRFPEVVQKMLLGRGMKEGAGFQKGAKPD